MSAELSAELSAGLSAGLSASLADAAVEARAMRGRLPAVALASSLTLAGSAGAVDIQQVVSPKGIEAWLVEEHTVPALDSLKPDELIEVIRWMCGGVGVTADAAQAQVKAAEERVAAAEAKADKSAKSEARLRTNYSKLLKRYNKLVAAAQKAGVDVATVTRLPAAPQPGGGGPPPLIPDFDDFLGNFM